MKLFVHIIIITMFKGLFGCKDKNPKDYVFEEFKNQIEKEGMKIDKVDSTGLIYISQGEWNLQVSLDNVRRNYERDKDESHITNLVQSIVSYPEGVPAKWTEAKNDIYISLFPSDYDFKDFLHQKVTDEFDKVYVHSDENKLTWIGKDDLKKWQITETELANQANINADKLLNTTEISFDTIENRKLGLIEVEPASLKGAILFAPSIKQKVFKNFGFPFYAVIPVRDFCYIFSEKDFDFFSERIGSVVVDEYKQSGHPITTEILKFTDKGVEAVGKFPIE